MRNPDGTLIGDLNDGQPALTSGSIGLFELATIDENQTVYDLLPVFVNKPPIIISPISEASDPPIKPYSTADATGNAMYLFPDGSVKIMLGTTFTFKLVAQQPSILNVENGIPTMIPPNQGLTYVWRKDGELVTSYELESLQSSLIVSGSTLKINNIQPEHAGSYICEVQNDIGTTVSETVNLEVLNLDFDDYFYKNLIKNPYGKQGTDEWESSSDDFISKPFGELPSEEYKKPNRVDLFGYTADMMHPRPYQIDTGVLRGSNMVDDLVKNRGSYFTRARYKYLRNGGVGLVRAYQDIDVTDIQALIKGGVFGVEGVRAVFGCYLGNAINRFLPTKDIIPLSRKTDLRYYVSSAPRLSVENTLTAGLPLFIEEDVYVTIEEYDNDIRLSSRYYTRPNEWTPEHMVPFDTPIESLSLINATSRVAVRDPWTSRKWYWWGRSRDGVRIYPTDIYNIGSLSPGEFIDASLLAAQDMYPDPRDRYTYGQYVEFKKLVIDKLNPKTTKIRVVLNFSSNDSRFLDTYKELLDASDDVFDLLSWEMPWKKNAWTTEPPVDWRASTYQLYKNQDVRFGGTDPTRFLPLGNDPRSMVTALNLALIPVLKQDPALTLTQTNNLFVKNNNLASFVPNVLKGRAFDPMGVLTNKWMLNFQMNANEKYIDDRGFIVEDDGLEISIDEFIIGQQPRQVDLNNEPLLPFTTGSYATAYVEGVKSAYDYYGVSDLSTFHYLKSFAKYRYIPRYQTDNGKINSPETLVELNRYRAAAQGLAQGFFMNDVAPGVRIPQGQFDEGVRWNQQDVKLRYFVVIGLPGNSQSLDPSYQTNLLNTNRPDQYDYINLEDEFPDTSFSEQSQIVREHYFPIVGYYLDIDLSDPINTKVMLSRTKDTYPPLTQPYDPATKTSGSFMLTHSIDEDGVFKCSLRGVMTTNMERGGMGYASIRDTLPNNQFVVANSTPIIPVDQRTTASIVTVYDHPIQCIRALRTNIGAYSISPLAQNYFYTQRVKDIIAPIALDIANSGSYNGPFTINELKNFSQSLNLYAFGYDVPRYNSGVIDTSMEPDPLQLINTSYTTTLSLDMADPTFANQYTLGLNPIIPPATPNANSRQTERSPFLLRLRSTTIVNVTNDSGQLTGEKVSLGPSLVAIRPVDVEEPGSGVGSPSYGYKDVYNPTTNVVESIPYVVVIGHIGDKVAGTYL